MDVVRIRFLVLNYVIIDYSQIRRRISLQLEFNGLGGQLGLPGVNGLLAPCSTATGALDLNLLLGFGHKFWSIQPLECGFGDYWWCFDGDCC